MHQRKNDGTRLLRWLNSLKMTSFRKNAVFLKISYLKPLITCKKHFEMILRNLPLDECEIQ